MVVRVVAEDAYGNERDGVVRNGVGCAAARRAAAAACSSRMARGGSSSSLNGRRRFRCRSRRAPARRCASSILRGSFATSTRCVRCLGHQPGAAGGRAIQLPLVVLDRFDNECETYSGSFAVTMTGDARVAGDLPPTFEVSGGRAMLPIIDQTAEMVTFTVHNAVLGSGGDGGAVDEAADAGAGDAAAGQRRRQRRHVVAGAGAGELPAGANTQVCRVVFGPGDAERLGLKVGRPGDERYTAPRPPTSLRDRSPSRRRRRSRRRRPTATATTTRRAAAAAARRSTRRARRWWCASARSIATTTSSSRRSAGSRSRRRRRRARPRSLQARRRGAAGGDGAAATCCSCAMASPRSPTLTVAGGVSIQLRPNVTSLDGARARCCA